jgi:hypothetical protein
MVAVDVLNGVRAIRREGRRKALVERKDTDQRDNFLHVGDRVRVISYSPFRGLRGTIRTVDSITTGPGKPFCFYLIALEGAHVQGPIWFEYDEVELVAPVSDAPGSSG